MLPPIPTSGKIRSALDPRRLTPALERLLLEKKDMFEWWNLYWDWRAYLSPPISDTKAVAQSLYVREPALSLVISSRVSVLLSSKQFDLCIYLAPTPRRIPYVSHALPLLDLHQSRSTPHRSTATFLEKYS
jgi:hypothetical protein